MRILVPAALASGLMAAGAARAGETACWFENGAVVVPAEVGGIAGDWLLDPSAPRTLLHETRAQMEGLPPAFTAPARLAGETFAGVEVTVADLDDRAPGFPTPIAGVIGADVLARTVADLDFAPCRLRLGGPAPRGGRTLRLTLVGGAPAVTAAIADDRRARRGLLAVTWSARAAVRVAGAEFRPPRRAGAAGRNLAPGRLRALSFDGELYEEVTANLADDLDPGLAGALGADVWRRWRVTLDIRRGRMILRPP